MKANMPGAGAVRSEMGMPFTVGEVVETSARVRRWGSPAVAAVLVAIGLSTVYVLLGPRAPDLAAQLARTGAAARGATVWWGGWYGGINLPTYSVVSGPLMTHLGVTTVGVLATVVVAAAAGDLLRTAPRPRAGAAAAGAFAAANLFSGRITFAVGMAVAVASLALLRRGRVGAAVVAAVASGLASPIAVLFLTLAAGALVATSAEGRRGALAVAGAAALPVAVTSAVFDQPSVMPFAATTFIATVVACAVVAALPVPTVARVGALLAGGVAVVAFVLPTPVGSNAARLPMLVAAPVVLAAARLRPVWAAALAAVLAAWPVTNLVHDLRPATDASAHAPYYAPLLARLPPAGTATQRLEVVDPRSHGADVYLPHRIPLARGWERQVDVADNAIFYQPDGLTQASYLAWLRRRGVGWVALPDAPVDWGAASEKRLVAAGLPYLRQVWRGAHWLLYRVTVPAPVARGAAQVTGMTDSTVRLHAAHTGTALVSIRYSRVLTLTDPAGLPAGCVTPAPGGDIRVMVNQPGDLRLEASLSTLTRDNPWC
jgi:hypothetical protein